MAFVLCREYLLKKGYFFLKEQQHLIDMIKVYTSNLKCDSSDDNRGVVPLGAILPMLVKDNNNILDDAEFDIINSSTIWGKMPVSE